MGFIHEREASENAFRDDLPILIRIEAHNGSRKRLKSHAMTKYCGCDSASTAKRTLLELLSVLAVNRAGRFIPSVRRSHHDAVIFPNRQFCGADDN